MQNYNPQIICLQETNFKEIFTSSNTRVVVVICENYTCSSKNRTITSRASGGVIIYVNSNIWTKELLININLETKAKLIEYEETFCKFNIYLSNQMNITANDIEDILKQL